MFRFGTGHLARDPSGRFLPWIVALMVFLAALALTAAMLVGDAIERWNAGLTGSMTVQIRPGETADDTDRLVERTLTVLRETAGVVAADPLPRERVAALLEPWLGSAGDLPDLPLPRLVDVRLTPGSPPDVPALRASLREIDQGIAVDDHQEWLGRLVRLGRSVEIVAFGVVGLIGAVAVAAIVFITLTRLAIHREVIQLLHVMGATDGFVAREFQTHALLFGFGGGLLGLLPAMVALWGLGRTAAGLQGLLLPTPNLSPTQWTVLALLPPASGLIAMATARITALVRLARMP